MLARAGSDPYANSRFVLSHANAFRTLGRIPYPLLHRLLVSAARAETWLRWPLLTLKLKDRYRESFEAVDPGGERFGISEAQRRRHDEYQLFLETPDLAVLILNLDDPRFRRRALSVHNADVLTRSGGPGAIIAGFRLGPYPVIPLVLAATGHPVTMIVGGEPLADLGVRLATTFAPGLARSVRFVNSLDPRVLAVAKADLDAGRLISTLVEMSPIQYAKTTPVRFLGWETQAAYGIPYLAAATGRSIVPVVMLRSRGPRFRLKFLDPIPPPSRDRASVFAATQALWQELERQVLKHPDQWVGWTRLQSHLGIDVTQAPAAQLAAIS